MGAARCGTVFATALARGSSMAGRVLFTPGMIDVGSTAPTFTRNDHLGREVDLGALRGRRHVLLLFYPLDFTPT